MAAVNMTSSWLPHCFAATWLPISWLWLPISASSAVPGQSGTDPCQTVAPLCSQMCVLGCLERQAEGASVVYLDTEKKFSGRRCGCLERRGVLTL